MVIGLDLFKKHFHNFKDHYVLIGGTACSINMQEAGLDFRATKDLDIVLYIEVMKTDFIQAFWKFIEEGGYENKQHSTSKEIFYRFSSPKSRHYPFMIELFSRTPDKVKLSRKGHLTPIPANEEVLSLSAILLNDDYYHFIHSGKLVLDGLSILNVTHLIPIKARAFIDLTNRKNIGERIDDRDIRKHKNDIFRLFQLLSPNTRVGLPTLIQRDFQLFLEGLKLSPPFDCKSLGLKNMDINYIIETLEKIYCSASSV